MHGEPLDSALFWAFSIFQVLALLYALHVVYQARSYAARLWVLVGPILVVLLAAATASLVSLAYESAEAKSSDLLEWAANLYALLVPVALNRILNPHPPQNRSI